jgi:dTDP-4-amino-4,6-dideoxygalactose transaminase
MSISLACVDIPPEAEARVRTLLWTGRIGQSSVIAEFEHAFAHWLGRKHAVAVTNGTTADLIAMLVLKSMNPHYDEVIMPALTFAAQLNAVLLAGLKPVFVDVNESLQMDGHKALDAITARTLCMFPVHLMGLACVWPESPVPVVEDTCEAMGTVYQGRKCGTMGDMATFSFFVSHTMTTGEGGMLVTDSDDMADRARTLRNHGKASANDFHFNMMGFNGKMTSLQATIGVAAIKRVDDAIQARRTNYQQMGGVERPGEQVCPHGFPVLLKSRDERDRGMARLRDAGIECRNLFSSLPTQEPAYAHLGHRLGEFPMAEHVGDCGLYVPCHQQLTQGQLVMLISTIRDLTPGVIV